DAARRLADLERLAVRDDRVARVGAALVAADDVRTLREQVDDLAFPLVAPLRANDDGRRHGWSVGQASWSWRSSRCANSGGCSPRRSTISWPAAQRTTPSSASFARLPRTAADCSASENRAPLRRAASRHGSQRHENDVAEGETQTVVVMLPPRGRRTWRTASETRASPFPSRRCGASQDQ